MFAVNVCSFYVQFQINFEHRYNQVVVSHYDTNEISNYNDTQYIRGNFL